MILDKRTAWISDSHPHRDIRLAASIPKVYANRLLRWAWLRNSDNPSLYDYIISSKLFLDELSLVYNRSFGADYRRQSENLVFEVDDDLQIGAFTKAIDTNPNSLIPVKIKLGTLFAIEDASHALLSDPQTLFGINAQENAIDRYVHRLSVHTIFDHYRYVDYGPIIKDIFDNGIDQNHISFCSSLFKFRSASSYRQEVADLLATMSLFWILSHEDAHNYLGHLLFFREQLGVSVDADALSFSELIAGILEERDPKVRKACEIEADTNACTRMVDHTVDSELFSLFPFLQAHQKALADILSEAAKDKYLPKQISFITLVRLNVMASLLAISVFERNVIKHNSNTLFYPNFIERAINIITTTIFRATQSIMQNEHYGLLPLLPRQLTLLIGYIVDDLKAIVRNVLKWNFLLFDSQMKTDDTIRVVEIIEDPDFQAGLAYTVLWVLLGQENEPFKSNFTKHCPLFYSFMQFRVEDMRICREKFHESRLKANPTKKAKVHESAELEIVAEASLRSRLKL